MIQKSRSNTRFDNIYQNRECKYPLTQYFHFWKFTLLLSYPIITAWRLEIFPDQNIETISISNQLPLGFLSIFFPQ